MLIEGKVGAPVLGDGADHELRLDRTGCLVVSSGRSRHVVNTRRNHLFWIDSGSITIAAANATGGALGTVKAINGFYNPPTSNTNSAIVSATIHTTSGTPGGPLIWDYIVKDLTQAATGTIRSGFLNASGTSSGSNMRPMADIVLASTGDTSSVTTKLGVLGGTTTAASGAGLSTFVDYVEGKIIVPPGAAILISSTATGTSHVVQTTICWEEFPV